jgi:hypothetical protein
MHKKKRPKTKAMQTSAEKLSYIQADQRFLRQEEERNSSAGLVAICNLSSPDSA